MTITCKNKWFIKTAISTTLFITPFVMANVTPTANYGLVQTSFTQMNNTFDRINDRMFDLHIWVEQLDLQPYVGFNAGDRFGVLGLWVNAMGSHLTQEERDEVAGYTAHTGGLAVGVDWRYNDCIALGLAVSYHDGHVNDNSIDAREGSLSSWQATGYNWIDFNEGIYLNTILGFGFNTYHLDRSISFNQINTGTHASVNGVQLALQTDLGWILVNTNQYYVTPFARLKYALLSLDHYDETGAPFLNLSVNTETVHEFLGGVGLNLNKPLTMNDLLFISEITLFLGYDIHNNGELINANFTDNSGSFVIQGSKPGKTIFNFGVGIHTHLSDESIFSMKYDLELRNKFSANSGYLEYYYLWD